MREIESGDPATDHEVHMFPKRSDVNVPQHRYPHCLVWCPLPIISWIFPPIGHVGIADSKGIIYDFAGPYYIGEDNMAFGWPTKYHQIDLSLVGDADTWDRGVWEANAEYKQRVHNLCCDNCHSHVAYAFNSMRYNGKSNWNMYSVWWFIFIHGKYTNFGGFLRTWLPFLILLTIVLLIAFLV